MLKGSSKADSAKKMLDDMISKNKKRKEKRFEKGIEDEDEAIKEAKIDEIEDEAIAKKRKRLALYGVK